MWVSPKQSVLRIFLSCFEVLNSYFQFRYLTLKHPTHWVITITTHMIERLQTVNNRKHRRWTDFMNYKSQLNMKKWKISRDRHITTITNIKSKQNQDKCNFNTKLTLVLKIFKIAVVVKVVVVVLIAVVVVPLKHRDTHSIRAQLLYFYLGLMTSRSFLCTTTVTSKETNYWRAVANAELNGIKKRHSHNLYP